MVHNNDNNTIMHQLLAPKNVTAILAKIRFAFSQFWHSLNLAQRYYLVAFILAIYSLAQAVDNYFINGLILVTTVTALCYEFWPRIMTFWHSVPGKALILLFYAFIANFVLVQADGRINDLTGVSTDNFPYTHNLSVLLSLPTWFFITSTLALILLQLLMTFYVILLFILKPFGIKPFWHQNHYRFPATTAVIRLVMCFVLLAFLIVGVARSGASETLTNFASDIKVTEQGLSFNGMGIKATVNPNLTPAEIERELAKHKGELPEPEAASPGSLLSEDGEPTQQGKNYNDALNSLLAYFIFRFESDESSRCEHTPGTNVIELNDYEILEIQPDEAAEYGYTYTVKPCISAAIGHQFKPQADKP